MEPVSSVSAVVINAFADVLLQKGIETAARFLANSSSTMELARRASGGAGIPATQEAVATWLRRAETRDLLASARVQENLPRLHETLVEELVEQWSTRVGTLPDAVPMDAVADAILAGVLRGFIASLDPSAAVAVADSRAEERHREVREDIRRVQALLAAGDPFEDHLRRFPPIVQDSLRALQKVDPLRAMALTRTINEAEAPGEAIRQLARGQPTRFVSDAPVEFWLAVADLAAAYGVREVESEAIEQAIEHGAPDRAELHARAALASLGLGNRARAEDHLRIAKEVNPQSRLVKLVVAMLAEDQGAILSASEGLPAQVHGVAVVLARALTLAGVERIDDAIAELRQALNEKPDWTSLQIWLGNLLLTKAQSSRGDEARRLRNDALAFGRRSRDLRRQWRGPSGESVELMARAAVGLGDMRLAYSVCVPDGEATAEEARSPEVLQILLTLVLDRQDFVRAETIAEQIDSPYHQFLARGAIAADGGRRQEAEQYLRQALDLARHEGERVEVIRYMSTAGIWPLPGFELVRDRDPDSAAILEASSFLSSGDPNRAIAALRPRRRERLKIADLLATAYLHAGRLDDAVVELQEAARYFNEPDLAARAAVMLSNAGRLDQAFAIASRVAYELPTESVFLPRIRVLLFNGLGARRDWAGAEEQARRLLESAPTSAEAGWALAVALAKQARLDEAWSNLKERRLSAQRIEDATLWVALAARYAPAEEWIPVALDLLDRFPDSEDFHALVLTSTVQAGARDLPPEIGERLRKAWSDFVERYPESKHLRPVMIGETDDEILKVLRSILEPRAEVALAQAKAVQDGQAPLGLMATVARQSYIESWLAGGTGTLNIYIPIREIAASEAAAAAAALDKEVIMDGSTLGVLSLIPSLASKIGPAFSRQVIPTSLRVDAREAVDSLASPSDGLLGWDPDAGRLTLTNLSAEQTAERRTRARWVEEFVRKLDVFDVPDFPDFPDLDKNAWRWLAALELAKLRGVPFYCDDAWVRRLAASLGISSFGTIDLLDVLVGIGKIKSDERKSAIDALVSAHAVSIPLSRADLLSLAESEKWTAGVAALQISQAGFWKESQAAARYEELLTKAAHQNAGALPDWLCAGILGASRNASENDRGRLASQLLASALAYYGEPPNVPSLIEAARIAAKRLGISDPLPSAAPMLRELLVKRLGVRSALVTVINLTAGLRKEDADVLKLPLFTPYSGAGG